VATPDTHAPAGPFGKDGGTTGVDEDFARAAFKMLGHGFSKEHVRTDSRPWPDMNWKGWWGDNPPYHVPVFILTHHARPPIEMEGNTTFSSSRAAFARRLTAREAAAEETCELVVGPTRSSSIFVEGLIDSCTLLSRRSCSVVRADCSKALTCGLWIRMR